MNDEPDRSTPADLSNARRQQQEAWLTEIGGPPGPIRDAAMRKLYDAYDRNMLKACRTYGLQGPDAQDVWQDTLLKVVEGAAAFRGESHPAQWIRTILKNKALDLLKLVWREHETSSQVPQLHAGADDAGEPGLRDLVDEAPSSQNPLLDECVRRGWREFTSRYGAKAMLLAMRDHEGLDIPELVAKFGGPEVNLRRRIADLRAKARPFLDPCRELLGGAPR